MLVVIALVAGAVLVLWLQRVNELFYLSVRDGRVLVVRGRIPAGMLSDIRDVVAKPVVRSATIRAIKQLDNARLVASGLDEGRTQRLRNIFSLYSISKLRSAQPIPKPTFGQVMGIAWLAWLLERR